MFIRLNIIFFDFSVAVDLVCFKIRRTFFPLFSFSLFSPSLVFLLDNGFNKVALTKFEYSATLCNSLERGGTRSCRRLLSLKGIWGCWGSLGNGGKYSMGSIEGC